MHPHNRNNGKFYWCKLCKSQLTADKRACQCKSYVTKSVSEKEYLMYVGFGLRN